ncbi:Methyltransferase [Heracleum sosnowskyi]|uniref:Methyltransferase n=1 Tax=Heracleum sosnowskyi TaxID=360622 RepID=A0AAD8I5B5_9APIA|nr:Methyltransferase [Heracleum sosnowskyi]
MPREFKFELGGHRTEGSGLALWPARLIVPPPRLADFGYSSETFQNDTIILIKTPFVLFVYHICSPLHVDGLWETLDLWTKQNIMDMKAYLRSFGASLKNKNVWVMNIVSEEGTNTLKLIYDRGLIGSVHNWCEAYSTYPRTYDLLRPWTVFSDIEKKV